ncbi:hypothetical protein HARCEL1_11645 [Halococcoides cellulosivorans]|uniref:Uncharacterized protein n=1 Tax=Halococcoides cellulosivorans TaxID=1679096 RepID=A0A2R4X3D9_9EURY|nr:hypothetical protein HARCEL1_11645 [Halococcoides cellulosivorans]
MQIVRFILVEFVFHFGIVFAIGLFEDFFQYFEVREIVLFCVNNSGIVGNSVSDENSNLPIFFNVSTYISSSIYIALVLRSVGSHLGGVSIRMSVVSPVVLIISIFSFAVVSAPSGDRESTRAGKEQRSAVHCITK